MASSFESRRELVLLDSCCLINLFATGRAEEILRALPYDWAVARYVFEHEVLEIGSNEEDDSSVSGQGRRSIHPLLEEFVERGLLAILDITSYEEASELVRFASSLDDGEAHTCAIALVRGARVATDDKKAIRVWLEHAPDNKMVLRTPDLLFAWADNHAVSESDLGRIVRVVARRASFFPPTADENFGRWMTYLKG